MNWVTTKGQILQIIIPAITLLITVVTLFVGAKYASPAMSSGNPSSAGAILFYVLVILVSVWSGFSMWFSLRRTFAPRGNEKREEIRIFFETYIQPLNRPVRYIEVRLRSHLRRSQDDRVRNFMLFVADYGKGIYGRATGALENEFVIPENGGIDPLHRKLKEFCNAYHGHVVCINHLVQFSSYPLKEDQDYEKWRDQHKLFHQELTKLLGKEKDSSILTIGLDKDWPDILR